MTKKHFIALADTVKASRPSGEGNPVAEADLHYLGERQQWEWMRDRLADFCQSQNPQFNRERWLDYIAGRCGSNGGTIKPPRAVSLAQLEHEESGCTDYLQHRAQDCPYLH